MSTEGALCKDKPRTNVLPLSHLGLLKMTRQRVEESIRSATYADCPYCEGRGNVKSTLRMGEEIQRHIVKVMHRTKHEKEGLPIKVIVNSVIMERLRTEDEAKLVELEQKYRGRLTFASDPGMHMKVFTIARAVTGGELYSNIDR